MKNTLAITALLALATTSPAAAHGGPVSNRNDWSTLSGESLQQLPPQISAAIRSAQRACGEDKPQTRTGFLRLPQGGQWTEVRFPPLRSVSLRAFVGALQFDGLHAGSG